MNDAFNEIVDRLIASGLEEYQAIILVAEFITEQLEELAVISMLGNEKNVLIN